MTVPVIAAPASDNENSPDFLISYYDDGRIKSYAQMKDGLLNGQIITWHEKKNEKEGVVSEIGNYKDGYRVNLFRQFGENGQMIQTILYPPSISEYVPGIPFLEKTGYDLSSETKPSHHIVYTKPCWEK